MAPNSAMKVPVFPILLSPSSPKISPHRLTEGGEEGGGQEKRQAKGRKPQKRGTNKRSIITSALEHSKH